MNALLGRSVVFGLTLGLFGVVSTASAQPAPPPAAGNAPQQDPNTGTNPTAPAPPPENLPSNNPAPNPPPPVEPAPNSGYGPATAPPPSPATPVPTAAEKIANAVTSLIRWYGTFKPTIDVSVGGTESYGQQNSTVPTAAANPILSNAPKDTRLTFQMQQTRFGFWVAEKSQARAHFELDFVDFGQSSPTVLAKPRMRIAAVEYEPVKNLVIAAGQDWDLYAPVNTFTTNLVGSNFLAGNTAFMRQQLKFIYTVPETVEVGFALGLQAQNGAALENGIELSRMPTFAFRAAAIVGKTGRIGVSGIATQLRLGRFPTTNLPELKDQRRGSYAGNIYADIGKADGFQLKAEGYIARNLANIGALSLGFARLDKDIEEMGGFISMRQQLAEKHAAYLTFGAAGVLNGGEVNPAYSYAAPVGTAAPVASISAPGTGPGIKFNMHGHIGYEYRPYKPIAIIVEPQLYRTRHVLASRDWGRVDPMRTSVGLQTAMMYFF